MLFAAPPLSPVIPEDELISPFGTPATERAVRIAREGLAAAEVLDASGMVLPAAEMKAATLEAAADAYRKRRHKGLRSPLRAVSAANGAIPRPPTPSPPSAVMVAAAAAPAYSAPWGAQLVEAEGQEWARRLSPSDIQAVIISGASLVRDTLAEGHRPFTLYQLHIPLRHSEHMAFRKRASRTIRMRDPLLLLGASTRAATHPPRVARPILTSACPCHPCFARPLLRFRHPRCHPSPRAG